MEIEAYEPGVPSWVDVSTPDVAKTAAFYRGLFGWDVQVGPPEFGGYASATLRGRQVAGIAPQMVPPPGIEAPPMGPPMWSTYVNVVSADDTAAKVAANGGTVLFPPMDVGELGRMAIFADPSGGVFGAWQPGQHKGSGLANEPGAFGWNELMTRDVEGAKAFYGAVFGWGSVTHEGPDGPPGGYTEWQVGGRSIGGMMQPPPGVPPGMPPVWGVYFVVEDTDAAVAKAEELGGSVRFPPMDIPQGRFATLVDSTGATFNVISMGAPAPGS